MKRRDFIRTGCTACVAATGLAGFLSSCKSTQMVAGKVNNDGILLDTNDFIIKKNGSTSHRLYVVVRNDALKFPICVYRFSDTDYTALWMECQH